MLSFCIPILQAFRVIVASIAAVVLFAFSVITLGGSVVALTVATPLFLLFSPILVPATITTALLTGGLSASAALGVTAMALIVWLLKHRIGVKPKNNPPPKGAPPTKAGKAAGTSGDPAAASGGKPGDKPKDKPAGDKPKDKPAGDKPAGPAGDKPAGAPGDKPAGAPGDKPAGGPGDKPAGAPGDKPAGGPGDKPAGGPGDKPAGGPEDKPGEEKKPPIW